MGRGAGREPWPEELLAAYERYMARCVALRSNPLAVPLTEVVEAREAFDAMMNRREGGVPRSGGAV